MLKKLKIDKTKKFGKADLLLLAEKLNEVVDALNKAGDKDAAEKKPAATRKTGNAKG